ncbi:hypothetical protein M0D21_16035 [Aquimarina sp. D1M17]|uniref:hypothetical protein n=1 Tax=Aquimarina acroporae TaxID=2937283 RepID=UPI0020C175CA|nr:hypothetical protein [Aquimarina acroporae]MCK8523088.1 hypothetical protein [Aquimarina acroporae]
MNTQKTNKITLKKITVSRINSQWMSMIKGGSSIPTDTDNFEPTARQPGEPCYHRP